MEDILDFQIGQHLLALPPPLSCANASTLASAKSLNLTSLFILLFTPKPAVAWSARAGNVLKYHSGTLL